MMKILHQEKGAALRIEILAEPETQEFISTHTDILNKAIAETPMSDTMRQRLQHSHYVFSGIKTFHELNEATFSLLDDNGKKKPFEQFFNDVRKINEQYNKNYLRAEYNFVDAAAQMAAKWEQYQQDGDRYNLQYRTAGDDKVRPEHAALNGITLPFSDPFWREYYPPNGWNCRCTVVQVRKNKYPVTPHDEAMNRGEEALENDKRGMFHFNPGIEQKSIPDYNPYTISKCKNCDIAKGKTSLVFVPENEVCAACKMVHKLEKEQTTDIPQSRSEVKRAQKDLDNWSKQNLPCDNVGKFPAKRFVVNTTDGIEVVVKRSFYKETINKFQNESLYVLKLAYAKKAHELITKATLTNPNEKSIDHPDATFRVYEYVDRCYRVEIKIRCNRDGNYMHILRIYKKIKAIFRRLPRVSHAEAWTKGNLKIAFIVCKDTTIFLTSK